VRQARFNQTGGQQLGLGFDTGASWLINRNLRLSLTYDFADVRNAHLPAGSVAGDYSRSLTLLALRVAL
jgi:long-subunit fatty acid transport protein